MVRTQVQLTEDQSRRVKELAAIQHVSMAEIIRRSIECYSKQNGDIDMDERRRRALALAGKYRSGLRDVSRNHDKYLAEAYAE